MILSEKHSFVFIHNQKTGGRSVRVYLKKSVPEVTNLLAPHARAVEGIHALGREKWDKLYSFGFVRNPWARMVSWYSMIQERPTSRRRNRLWKHVQPEGWSFAEFIAKTAEPISLTTPKGTVLDKRLIQNQLDYFTDDKGEVAVKFIGRFENLQSDFDKITKALGHPPSVLPRKNATSQKDYRSFYDNHTKKIVAERFKRDIDYFGYTFEK